MTCGFPVTAFCDVVTGFKVGVKYNLGFGTGVIVCKGDVLRHKVTSYAEPMKKLRNSVSSVPPW